METRNQEKPLSIAMREINEGLLVSTPVEEKPAEPAATEPVIDFGDAGMTGLGDEPTL